jgi:hypothetical protein
VLAKSQANRSKVKRPPSSSASSLSFPLVSHHAQLHHPPHPRLCSSRSCRQPLEAVRGFHPVARRCGGVSSSSDILFTLAFAPASSSSSLAFGSPRLRVDLLSDCRAKKCTTINIHAMSVPSGKTLDLSNLLTGTHVIMHGDVTFNSGTTVYWEGPLFRITGNDVTYVPPSPCLCSQILQPMS